MFRSYTSLLRVVYVAMICFVVICFTMVAKAVEATGPLNYARDVRPILSDVCYRCHGPDPDTREAELRLDTRGGLFESRDGKTIVKPRDVSTSELVKRILSDDDNEVMPPRDSKKQLTPAQREILVEWVKQGATWEQHWAFVAPRKSELPKVSQTDWCKNEIDYFVLSRIESAGLSPSAEADAFTLVRRLYLDLIGLPPSPNEADEWVKKIWHDGSTDEAAYQELVSHLLDLPSYGERWARRWLDLARYADTNGYEKDRDRSIWPYRDWVINALNRDMPFDQFTIEQIAGDMLPSATMDQRIATGFHRNTMLNEEGGIDPLEFRWHAMTDRVATTGTTWLGLTLGCCQCHTHKYDPITHREYYQFMAFLNNADEPSLDLPDESADTTWKRNLAESESRIAELAEKWPIAEVDIVTQSKVTAKCGDGPKLRVQEDQSILVVGENSDKATYEVTCEIHQPFDQITLQTFARNKQPGPGRTKHGNFVLSEIEFAIQPIDVNLTNASSDAAWTKLTIDSAKATVEQSTFEIGKAFDGDSSTGWAIHTDGALPKTADATFVLRAFEHDWSKPQRLRVRLSQVYGDQHTIAAFSIQCGRRVGASPDQLVQRRDAALKTAFESWLTQERANSVKWTSLKPSEAKASLPILTIQDDDSIFASGDTAKRDDYWIKFAPLSQPITALRLEALPDDRLPAHGPGSTYYEGTLGDFYLTEFVAKSGDDGFQFHSATDSFSSNRFGSNPANAALAIDGDVQTGWSVNGRQGERHVAYFVFQNPLPANKPLDLQLTFGRHFASSLGRFRISATHQMLAHEKPPAARDYSSEIAQLLQLTDEQLSSQQRDQLKRQFLLDAPELDKLTSEIRKLQKRPEPTSTMVLSERPTGQKRSTYIHHRGEFLQPKDVVEPATPEMLHPLAKLTRDRLGFAKWLVAEDNPLTARVVVNRHWATLMGTGIVKTVDDFGMQGEAPSHPELLDWLAITHSRDDKWSTKLLHRRIVSSATYRQSTLMSEAAAQKDPENRLLSHASRFRLEAELVRDRLLKASKVLDSQLGGPPVRPLQPEGVTEVAFGSPKWNASANSSKYRRSIYTYTKRTAPFAMFTTFDAPTGEACTAKRNRSNTPLQSLTLLNDVMFIDLARQAARQILAEEGNDQVRLQQLFRQVLVRPARLEELAELENFLQASRVNFASNPEAAKDFAGTSQPSDLNVAEMASWSATVRVLFGLDEALNRE